MYDSIGNRHRKAYIKRFHQACNNRYNYCCPYLLVVYEQMVK